MSNKYFSSYSDEEEELQIALVLAEYVLKNKKKQKRKFWVNPYLKERNREGRFKSFEDMKNYAPIFTENFHMDADTFEKLFRLVEPIIDFKVKTQKDFISAKQKFACVLEYLASGSLQRHVASVYRISKQHFRVILSKYNDALCTF